MQTIDFARSFLTFRIDTLKKPPKTVSHKPPSTLNNARIQIDCRCTITEKASGQALEFVLGANCKTERVGVERDIWTDPNADFVPILSAKQCMFLKAWDRAGRQVMLYPPSLGAQPERQVGTVEETFDRVRIDVASCAGELLTTPQQIVAATHANQLLVARTSWETARYAAAIEYPIKTMNVSERDWIYQTDTGPVLFPDLSREPADLIGGLDLAFSAFNCPQWIEFIVRVPTPVAEGISVHHYSKPVHMDVKNEVFRLL
jgi:hypothetical protein